MATNYIKRLGITYDKDLIGIITAVDLINVYLKRSGSSPISHWKEIK
jgi:signal-transduction protein with cAMP-binding, CBS, and nucleotidyltransferase domain